MRVLLDACVPQDLRHGLGQHNTMTARYAGLSRLDNGKLLDAMVGQFDVLVTTDKRLQYQQNLAGRTIAVVVLNARGNRLKDLLPLVPELLTVLDDIQPGEVREVAG
jgi:hypothetical protein